MTAAPPAPVPLTGSDYELTSNDTTAEHDSGIKPTHRELHADRLSYMADMIKELQVMARNSQCETLAGILGLAHAEARQQITSQTR